MNRRRFLARSLSLCPFTGCAHRVRTTSTLASSTLPWQSLQNAFDAEIPRLMGKGHVPGVSIAVIYHGRKVSRRVYGVANASSGTPVTADTIFEAGSMSKPAFTYVALKLCEKGIIGLDTPVSRYAPTPFLADDPRLELITPRHILSHSSGFQNWRSAEAPLRIHFEPGSQFLYSGEGYYYLQSVITHLCGRTFPDDCASFERDLEVCATDISDFLKRNLLEPFRMKLSGYELTPAQARLKATGHDQDGQPFPAPQASRPAVTRYASAGALSCTPSDYARFMIEVIDPGDPDSFRLKPETVREMLRPHVKVGNDPHNSSWALGWQVQNNGLINHGGDNKGFHCHAVANPRTKSGLVVMTNGDSGPDLIHSLLSLPATDLFFELSPFST